MSRAWLVVWVLLALGGCGDETAEDGLYVEASVPKGPVATTDDGREIHVGERVPLGNARTALVSQSNENDRFILYVEGTAVPLGQRGRASIYFVANGRAYRGGFGDTGEGFRGYGFPVQSREAGAALATLLAITPKNRTHPGHKLDVAYLPKKASFRPDEPVVVTLRMQNTGTETVYIRRWHPRLDRIDHNFTFTAWRGKDRIPNKVDGAYSFSRFSQRIEFTPGHVESIDVDLRLWFDLPPGTYRVEGSYRIRIHTREYKHLWDDAAVGTCTVTVSE